MITKSSPYSLFVTCPKGLEGLLEQELMGLGGEKTRQTVAGVEVTGDLGLAYRACLWSRLGNKVLLALGRCGAETTEALYRGISAIDWAAHMDPEGGLWIDVVGTNNALRNTQFAAQTVKDAIVDQFRAGCGQRPSISRQPDLIVNVRIKGNQAVINVDLSGESLHKRGYRGQSVSAPLKENLAAALLLRAAWPARVAEGYPLIDPMCGSGTLLIEAALMAADIAPGLNRRFAVERWKQHRASQWEAVKTDALARQQRGLAENYPEIRGYDEDPRAVAASKHNAAAAGVDTLVRVMLKPLAEFKRPTHANFDKGLLLTNPPYGERLGERQALLSVYGQLGDTLRREFGGWQAGVFTGSPELGKAIGLRSHKRYKLFNGSIASELLLFEVFHSKSKSESPKDIRNRGLSDGAQMVANRLQKNRKQLQAWLAARQTNCYRVYDADLPEYAAAIDIYADKVHIQEYQAPKSVAVVKAEQRLNEIVAAVEQVFGVTADDIGLKQRRRQRGDRQYEPVADSDKITFVVEEGKARFYVDLKSYLDTGLFLDHRLVRERLAGYSLGKSLLNLFCYTATATVQAALGGASSSISVDMSNTYLHWAQRNFDLNHIGKKHQLIQADCVQWLQQCRQAFDVIFLDPPSFSNSKRMSSVLDIQRDHVSLLKRCMDLLNQGGVLVFSTNLRKFKFDYQSLVSYDVEDISISTIDKDFQRNAKIHQCFILRHR